MISIILLNHSAKSPNHTVSFEYKNRIIFADSHDWMTPRASISSVISAGLQNFVYNADIDSEEEKEDEEVFLGFLNSCILEMKLFC